MINVQGGIVAESAPYALFIVLRLDQHNKLNASALRQMAANLPKITEKINKTYAQAKLTSVIAFSYNSWHLIYPNSNPPSLLTPFPAIVKGKYTAPATPGDIFIHIRSQRQDINVLLAQNVMTVCQKYIHVEEEVFAYRYLDNRDLTGFIDGTENPTGENRAKVALVDDNSPFSEGSYIHCQRYEHHLLAWQHLATHKQEQIIGRTKDDNIEFSEKEKADFAHIKRVSIKDTHGESIEILRHSLPCGCIKNPGLFFVSYAATPIHFEVMLKKMFIPDKNNNYDHLMQFSTAKTGTAFFAPSISFMEHAI